MSDEPESKYNEVGERFNSKNSDGQVIAGEGPGKGFASYPWALDRYERALDLEPAEGWLLKRMIKHVWESKGTVFVSMSGVCREAKISRATLDKLIFSLLQKGYIQEVGRGRTMRDHRVRYDISGLFLALHMAIKCDPGSQWAQMNGGPKRFIDFFKKAPKEWESYTSPKQVNQYENFRGWRYNWGEGKAEPWNGCRSDRAYSCVCQECGKDFDAGAPNAKFCCVCREERRKTRWNAFQEAYETFAEEME